MTGTITLGSAANLGNLGGRAGHGLSAIPLGDYAGSSNPSGVADFGFSTGTHPTYATEYLDKTDGWAAHGRRRARAALEGLGLPPRARRAHPARDRHLGGRGDRELRPVLHDPGQEPRERRRSQRHLAPGVGVQRLLVPVVRPERRPTRRTSTSSGSTSSRPCGPWPGSSSSSCGAPSADTSTSYIPAQAYPGNAYVDYVGTDDYDEFWGTPFTAAAAWSNQLTQQWGLNWLAIVRRPPTASPSPSRSGRSSIRDDGARPGGRPVVHRQHGRLVRRPPRGLRRHLLLRLLGTDRTTSSTAPSPSRWPSSRRSSADRGGLPRPRPSRSSPALSTTPRKVGCSCDR